MTVAHSNPVQLSPLLLSHYTLTTCLGTGLDGNLAGLQQQRSGLVPCNFETVQLDTAIGAVAGLDAVQLRADLAVFNCRNNRLAQFALEQDGFAAAVNSAVAHYGTTRVGVFIGTSTAGILETEIAYRNRDPSSGALPQPLHYRHTHNPYSAADFVRHYFGLQGPAFTVSTACSSSAKVFGSAQRMIAAGLIDAAIVGGVDSLCLTTLYGFASLQLTSAQPCRPFDNNRDGISIGEGAAFVLLEKSLLEKSLLEKTTAARDAAAILLLGVGESSDAYHMSSPHPQGLGAQQAMRMALQRAALTPADIDYINLHGTATTNNDAAEGFAVNALFGSRVPASSTKGATGHTLGAAGAVEAIFGALALRNDLIPAGVNTTHVDPTLPIDYVLENRRQSVRHILSNSFGFGGTNCTLILARAN